VHRPYQVLKACGPKDSSQARRNRGRAYLIQTVHLDGRFISLLQLGYLRLDHLILLYKALLNNLHKSLWASVAVNIQIAGLGALRTHTGMRSEEDSEMLVNNASSLPRLAGALGVRACIIEVGEKG
jgi:hypothetical protein